MAEHLVLSLEGTTGVVEEAQLVYIGSTTTTLRYARGGFRYFMVDHQ
jgi:hypothetical protein